jgi:DNA-directed RNA polymerase specialized sigma54-like protein
MSLGPKLIAKPMLKQALTPGLVQMVSILAMNKLELQEAISQELLENPLLEEAQEDVPTLEELNAAEQELRREAPADEAVLAATSPSDSGAGSSDSVEAGAEADSPHSSDGEASASDEPAADASTRSTSAASSTNTSTPATAAPKAKRSNGRPSRTSSALRPP